MAKVDEIVANMPLGPKRQAIEDERIEQFVEVPRAQSLGKRMPHKYVRQYEALLKHDPAKAKAFFESAAIEIKAPALSNKHEPALHTLGRVGMDNTLKRRI